MGDFASKWVSPYTETQGSPSTETTQVNVNAPLHSVGDWSCWAQRGKGYNSHHWAEGPGEEVGLPSLLSTQGTACQCWHRLGDLSLAARRERHRNLSLMSWLGMLMANWKWQGMQGWAACTKVTHPSFSIPLLKGNYSLECSRLSRLPGSLSCVLQVSAQMSLSQGGHPAPPFETSPLLHSTPELYSLCCFPT